MFSALKVSLEIAALFVRLTDCFWLLIIFREVNVMQANKRDAQVHDFGQGSRDTQASTISHAAAVAWPCMGLPCMCLSGMSRLHPHQMYGTLPVSTEGSSLNIIAYIPCCCKHCLAPFASQINVRLQSLTSSRTGAMLSCRQPDADHKAT